MGKTTAEIFVGRTVNHSYFFTGIVDSIGTHKIVLQFGPSSARSLYKDLGDLLGIDNQLENTVQGKDYYIEKYEELKVQNATLKGQLTKLKKQHELDKTAISNLVDQRDAERAKVKELKNEIDALIAEMKVLEKEKKR